MNTQVSSVNKNISIRHSGNKIHTCFGNLHGRLVSAIKNMMPTFAKFFGLSETVKVQPALPKQITITSFSFLSSDVTRLIVALLPEADMQNFRSIETFTNRCVTKHVLHEKLACLEAFTTFLSQQLSGKLTEAEENDLKLNPEFRQKLLESSLKTVREVLHSMKFVLVHLLMKHFSLDKLKEFNGLCFEAKITAPNLSCKGGYFNRTVISSAIDFSTMYDKRREGYDSSLDYWLKQGYIESSQAYIFEIDLIINRLESELGDGNLISGLGYVFRNIFYTSKKYPADGKIFVQKIEQLLSILSNISDEQLKIGYLNTVLGSIHYKESEDTILSTFCTSMATTIESLSNSEAKKELEANLKAFFPYINCDERKSIDKAVADDAGPDAVRFETKVG